MSAELNRRTFIGLASGTAVGVSAGVIPARAQSSFVLIAEVVTVELGFALKVTFDLASLGTEPLFVQVADSKGANIFFTWDDITAPSGTVVEDLGPYDLPYGLTYLVSIVNETGEQVPFSPVVQVEAPGFPEATFD